MSDSQALYCLNTSTIRNCGLSVEEKIVLAAQAGYDGIELWVDEIEGYVKAGGILSQLHTLLERHSLQLPNLIAFFQWANPDDSLRAGALQEARTVFDMADALGSTFVAASPAGITDRDDIAVEDLARYYADLLDVTRSYNAQPLLEFWGLSKTLGELGQAMQVAELVGNYRVYLLADVFHMAKTEGSWQLLRELDGAQLGLFHINDYPYAPDIRDLDDSTRVYPGDGVANLSQIIAALRQIGYQGMFSLELFNAEYEQSGAEHVARIGLQKMRNLLD